MPASLVTSEIELPANVLQLATKLGVTAYLPRVLEMTRSVFPGTRPEVEVEEDPEIADEDCLAIVVRNTFDDALELVEISTCWHRRLYDCCPPHLASAFRLNTDWLP